MLKIEWDKISIAIMTLALGISIGHLQKGKWSDIREKALIKQIERQSCDDVNPFNYKE